MKLQESSNKLSFNHEDNKKNFHKKKEGHYKNYNNDYDQRPRHGKGGKFNKTHGEGFRGKGHNHPKERNYEYENRKERDHEGRGNEGRVHNSAHKNNYKKNRNKHYDKGYNKNYNKNYGKNDYKGQGKAPPPYKPQEETKEVMREERGGGERGEESKGKPGLNNQKRRIENKALFARQLGSIQKTLTEGQKTTNFKPQLEPKMESKPAAIHGREIMNAKDDRKFPPAGPGESRRDHLPPKADDKGDKGKPFRRDKRNNLGFKASAAAIISGQTGGKGNFADYT